MKVPKYVAVLEKAVRDANLQPGQIYHTNIRHDDDCRGFTTGVIQLCDCDPTVDITRVDIETTPPASQWIN